MSSTESLDPEGDERRRQRRRRELVVQRRRRAAVVAMVVPLAAFVAGLMSGAGAGDSSSRPGGSDAAVLPDGERRIFPGHRVVAFYGAPQAAELGELGIGRPSSAVRRLRKQAAAYRRPGTPQLLGLELIATIANASPGQDGLYRSQQEPEVIDRYLRAARRAKALLILDVQPGRADFLSEAKRLRRWLEEPDVSLALDPEWRTPDAVPGQVIGSVTSGEVNQVSDYVAQIVKRGDLPQKLLVLHQFTADMIQDPDQILPRRGLALTFNVDGFGDRPNKVSKYDSFARRPETRRFHHGFKLFYKEDTNLMSPRQVLGLRPQPRLVVYE